jgi:hypothetical protein
MNNEEKHFDHINELFKKEKAQVEKEIKREKIYACLILGSLFATIFAIIIVPNNTVKGIALGLFIGFLITHTFLE